MSNTANLASLLINPLATASSDTVTPQVPMAPVNAMPTNPLAPGTTPASLGATATPNNPEGQPIMPVVGNPLQPAQPAPPPAARPGSFGAKLLQAIGGVLTGVSGVGQQAMAATGDPAAVANLKRQEDQRRYDEQQRIAAQERQQKLTEQQRIQQREDDEAHSRIAEASVRTMAVRNSDYYLGQEHMEKQVAQGKIDEATFIGREGIVKAFQSGVTGDQMHALLQQNKFTPYEYTAFQTGLKATGDVDENGHPTYQYTYDLVKVPQTLGRDDLTDDQIARIKTLPDYKNFQKGTILSGPQALLALRQVETKENAEAMNDADRERIKQAKLTDKQKDDLADFNTKGDWLRYMSAYKGDRVGAAKHMLADPAMAKKYGAALYNDVLAQFADKNDPTGSTGFETAADKQAENAIKAEELRQKKETTQIYEGNFNLTGEAFMRTMDPQQTLAVREAGDGKMNIKRLDMLVTKSPSFVDAVAAYTGGAFDSTKVEGYNKAYIEYNDDRAGSVGGALNAAGTALKTLRRLYDHTTTASLRPDSEENKQRANDAHNAAIEVAKFQAGGRQPGKEDIERIESDLNPKVPYTAGLIIDPINRRATIKEQTELIQKKISEYEEDWHQKAPSPRYEAPMPNMSNSARIDSAYVLGDGKYTVPPGAQRFQDPKTKHQIFTFDGKTYYDSSNGQPFDPNTPPAPPVRTGPALR